MQDNCNCEPGSIVQCEKCYSGYSLAKIDLIQDKSEKKEWGGMHISTAKQGNHISTHKNNAKYMLFCGCDYYPLGGWDDFKGFFDTIEEAKQYCISEHSEGYMWMHIVHDEKIVLTGWGDRDKSWKFKENEE